MESVPEVGEGRRATDGVLHHPPVPQSVEDLSARPLIVSANALSWRARTAVAEAAVAPADQRAGGAGGELLEVGWDRRQLLTFTHASIPSRNSVSHQY